MKPKSRNRLFYPHFPRGPSHHFDFGEDGGDAADGGAGGVGVGGRGEPVTVLGKGRFGRIVVLKNCRLKDDPGGGEVVVKVMQKRKVIEEKMIQQVLEERENHSRCSHHPSIVPVLSSYQDEHHLYLLLPLCATNLSKLLSSFGRGALLSSARELREASAQLTSAVRFVHDLGVVHRDVKPENVLVSGCGRRLLLSDFGLSKKVGRRKRTRTICGTLQHMAPEILEERPYSHPADWWSLGVLLHRLATGRMPWPRGRDHREQLRLVDLSGVDLSASSADSSVRSLVVACFEPDDLSRERAATEAAVAVEERAKRGWKSSTGTRKILEVLAGKKTDSSSAEKGEEEEEVNFLRLALDRRKDSDGDSKEEGKERNKEDKEEEEEEVADENKAPSK